MKLNLVYYEIKKVCSQSYVFVLLLLLLIANVVFCRISVSSDIDICAVGDYASKVYALYQTDPQLFFDEYEKVEENRILNAQYGLVAEGRYGGGIIEDISLFKYVNLSITANERYHEQLASIIKQSTLIKNSLSTSTDSANTYNYHYQEQIIRKYTYLNENVELGTEFVTGWNEYFKYKAEIIFSFAAILICSILLAVNDYIYGFFAIEKTCSFGRKKTALAKYITAALFSILISGAFMLSSLISAGTAVDFSRADVPIQSVEAMKLCPLHVSIFQFLFADMLMKMVAAVLFSTAAIAISSILRNVFLSFLCGGGLLLLNYFISAFEPTKFGQWKYINLWSGYTVDPLLSRYRTVNIGGESVSLLIIGICGATIFLIISLFIHCFGFTSIRGAYRKINVRKIKLKNPFSHRQRKMVWKLQITHLLSFEQYKRLWIIPLFAAVVILKCINANKYYAPDTSSYARAYRSYMEVIKGEYSDEKAEYLQSEYSTCVEILSKYNENSIAFYTGKLTKDDYLQYCTEFASAQGKYEVLNDLLAKTQYLKSLQQKGITGSYFNELDYKRFAFRGTDWYIVLLLWLIGISTFAIERSRTSSSFPPMMLIRTTPKGRKKILRIKYGFTVFYAIMAYVILKGIDIFYYYKNLEVPPSDTLLISLNTYRNAGSTVTILQHSHIMLLLGLLGALIISLVCLLISFFAKSNLTACVISAFILFAPSLLQLAGIELCQYFEAIKVIDTEGLYRLSLGSMLGGKYGFMILVFGGLSAGSGIFSAVSFLRIEGGKN